jgi:hypothetical protein
VRPPALLAVAVAGALALAGCGGGGQKKTAAGQQASVTSVTEAPTTTTTASGAVGATATTTAAGAKRTATTAAASAGVKPGTAGAGSSTAAPAPGSTGPATPLATGTYRYDTTGSSQSSGGASRPMPALTSLKADPASGASQHTTRDLRDANGQGQTIETVLVYQPDGVHLSSIKVTTVVGGGITDVRDLHADPPPLIARTNGAFGDRYEFTLTGSGTTFHGVITIQRTERLVIGGQPVNTAVARLHIDFSGAVTGTQDSTAWVDPAHLLNVKEQVTSDAHAGALSTHTEYTATLQHLSPG